MSANEPEEQVWDLELAKLMMDFVEHKWGKEKAAWLLPREGETQA